MFLVNANLPDDSVIRELHEVVEVNPKGAGQSNVPIAALWFLQNQLRMARVIARCDEVFLLPS